MLTKQQKREVREAVETGNIEKLKTFPKLDMHRPLYVAVQSCEDKLDIIKYLVEEREIYVDSDSISRALECEYLNVARYLKEKGGIPNPDNYIESVEVMKLANEWGLEFDSEAFSKICQDDHRNILVRLKYLFEELKHPYPILKKDLEQIWHTNEIEEDSIFEFSISHTTVDIATLMEIASKGKFFNSIDKLIKVGVPFTFKNLKLVMSSTNFERVDKLRKLVNSPINFLYSFMFKGLSYFEPEGSVILLIKHYNSPTFLTWIRDSNFMLEMCKRGNYEAIDYLISQGIEMKSDHIMAIYNYQLECLDRDSNLLSDLAYSLKFVDENTLEILNNTLWNYLEEEDDMKEVIEQFEEFYGKERFNSFFEKLEIYKDIKEKMETD